MECKRNSRRECNCCRECERLRRECPHCGAWLDWDEVCDCLYARDEEDETE